MARLEGLTKDYDCVPILSERAAALAGSDVAGHELLQASVKGRSEMVQCCALQTLAELSHQPSLARGRIATTQITALPTESVHGPQPTIEPPPTAAISEASFQPMAR